MRWLATVLTALHACDDRNCGGDVRGDAGEVVADAGYGNEHDPMDPADGGMDASLALGRAGPPRT